MIFITNIIVDLGYLYKHWDFEERLAFWCWLFFISYTFWIISLAILLLGVGIATISNRPWGDYRIERKSRKHMGD